MARKLFFLGLLILYFIDMKGQISEGGLPYSKSIISLKASTPLPGYELQRLDTSRLMQPDSESVLPFRYAVFEDVYIDLKSMGRKDTLEGMKGYLWRFRISSFTARSIQIIFKLFVVPAGAKLFLYNDDQTQIAGAFTKNNVRSDSVFVIADFNGDHVTIEYFEPADPEYKGKLIIGSVSQAYRDILKSADGFLNINCPEGKDAQLQKHAVCKMTFKCGIYSCGCSGALINNVRQDGTPYFLTANHCISKSSEASTLITYFNYENVGCNGTEGVPLTLSGASLLTTGDESDYSLLLLKQSPTKEMQPYYAGWDVTGESSNGASSIHHPLGLTKKLSVDYNSVNNYPYYIPWDNGTESLPNTHWRAAFDIGKTEEGSSGGPLFNNKRQIIGQLHGGNDLEEYYGKLSYSWTHKSSGLHFISYYLDPNKTGALAMDGYAPVTNLPDAFFEIPSDLVCANSPITLKDHSVFGPYERKWTITPSSFTFADETSDTSANPVLLFHNNVRYIIRLDIGIGGITKSTETNSLNAGGLINVSVNSLMGNENCDCDFNQFNMTASGASEYLWSMPDTELYKVVLDSNHGDTVGVHRQPGFVADSSYSLNFVVIGKQGACADTSHVAINVFKPSNDNVVHAKVLNYGASDILTNICATIEEGEPIPPHSSCTSQLSWCDESVSGDVIVKNSVWFRFVATGSGKVSIASLGMDNEIALYEAESSADILNNNFTLLRANDDQSTYNYFPKIMSVTLIPGKTYWIQVDGSAGNMEGNFYMLINDLNATAINESIGNKPVVFPQPADGIVFIGSDKLWQDHVLLSIYNMSGKLISHGMVDVQNKEISVNVSGWEPGVYIALINTGQVVLPCRIIKK
jgi:hypothetical protein